jgi:hypothetical protein
MAAGDVVIVRDVTFPRGSQGDVRWLWGTVTLDGSNPTPIALAGYLSVVDAAVVSLEGAAAPGVDPSALTSAISGTTINVYAWKITATDNGTLIASTDNARLVNWFASGPRA